MRHTLLAFFFIIASALQLNAQSNLQRQHPNLGHLLPQPQSVVFTSSAFTIGTDISVQGDTDFVNLTAVAHFLDQAHLQRRPEATSVLTLQRVARIEGAKRHNLAHFDDEAYALTIAENAITIRATTKTGIVRAMQTLRQLAIEYPTSLPGCKVIDWPAFTVRGFMHDIGRAYISTEELKRQIDLLALHKVNVFFWHLSDKHGFRFESKAHPNVNTNFTPTRSSHFYTQAECREIQDYAYERGMTIIPEIDMPGHSERFKGATGYTMVSTEGRAILKDILREVTTTFDKAPYIHIGGDETPEATVAYINEMADFVHSLGRKVAIWNRYGASPAKLVDPQTLHCDFLTNWATAGQLVKGLPNVDMRYNYINHFDVFADLAGLYRSNIFYATEGNSDVAGTITGLWNDRLISDEKLIVRENNLYANALVSAERAWRGGGKQYIEEGGAFLPNSGDEYEAFKDWEERFLFQKDHALSAVAADIPYVKQTNIRWNVTPAYSNEGNSSKKFTPETTDSLSPLPGSITVTGAGVWLNHIWGGTIAGVLGKAAQSYNQTRYAWTYIYSDSERKVGLYFQTYDYSRSQRGTAPSNGKWDKRNSRIWINDKEIRPTWKWTTKPAPANTDSEESELGNLNFTARPPISITLKAGWNKVLIKLPFVQTDLPYSQKWQWTCVFTDEEGRNAAEGLIFSPYQRKDDYFEDAVPLPPFEVSTQKVYQLQSKRGNRLVTASAVGEKLKGEVRPTDPTTSYWYFVPRQDGTYNIAHHKLQGYIQADGIANGSPMTLAAKAPNTGWRIVPTSLPNHYAIVGGTHQFNQQNNGNYFVLNWGGGTNLTDEGCQYIIREVEGISPPNSEDNPSSIASVTTSNRNLTPHHIYNLKGQRVSSSRHGILIVDGKKQIR